MQEISEQNTLRKMEKNKQEGGERCEAAMNEDSGSRSSREAVSRQPPPAAAAGSRTRGNRFQQQGL